ncbi:MAG: phosphoribosyltransferase [bacterium]
MAQDSYDYSNRKGIRPISWEEFHGICKALAESVSRFHPEIILAVSRGGLYPGTLIAHILQLELYPIRISRRVNDIVTYTTPQWSIEPPAAVKGKRVLIVDEICSEGETIILVKQKAISLGAKEVRSTVLYAHTKSAQIPDYIGIITDELLLNPWDREIYRNSSFQFHPEYTEALKQQEIKPDISLLINATPIKLAKG